jgi:hypothetical protein
MHVLPRVRRKVTRNSPLTIKGGTTAQTELHQALDLRGKHQNHQFDRIGTT